jgi:tetratricopeptide (TPR) repeat protein
VEGDHALLAGAYDNEWDWAAAREYERALQLDPNNSRTHVLYDLHFVTLGNNDESIAHIQRAVQLDPLNLNVMTNLAAGYLTTRRYDQSVAQVNKVLEIDTNYPSAHLALSLVYEAQGKYDFWLDELEKAATLTKDADLLACLRPRVCNAPGLDIVPPPNGSRKFWKHNQNGYTSTRQTSLAPTPFLMTRIKRFSGLRRASRKKATSFVC